MRPHRQISPEIFCHKIAPKPSLSVHPRHRPWRRAIKIDSNRRVVWRHADF